MDQLLQYKLLRIKYAWDKEVIRVTVMVDKYVYTSYH